MSLGPVKNTLSMVNVNVYKRVGFVLKKHYLKFKTFKRAFLTIWIGQDLLVIFVIEGIILATYTKAGFLKVLLFQTRKKLD